MEVEGLDVGEGKSETGRVSIGAEGRPDGRPAGRVYKTICLHGLVIRGGVRSPDIFPDSIAAAKLGAVGWVSAMSWWVERRDSSCPFSMQMLGCQSLLAAYPSLHS